MPAIIAAFSERKSTLARASTGMLLMLMSPWTSPKLYEDRGPVRVVGRHRFGELGNRPGNGALPRDLVAPSVAALAAKHDLKPAAGECAIGDELPCRVRRESGKLVDEPGLVAKKPHPTQVSLAFSAAPVAPLLIANVGEEGEGNLSGMRFLCRPNPARPQAFLILDGPGTESITNRALASRRFEVVLSGQGGHSWSDHGAGNPVHAIARAISNFTESMPTNDRPAPGLRITSDSSRVA